MRLSIPFCCIPFRRIPIINLADLCKIITDFTEELLIVFFFKYLNAKPNKQTKKPLHKHKSLRFFFKGVGREEGRRIS